MFIFAYTCAVRGEREENSNVNNNYSSKTSDDKTASAKLCSYDFLF